LLELPDSFSLAHPDSFHGFINHPNFSFVINEQYFNMDIEESRCYALSYNISHNREEDIVLSQLSQHKTVVLTPKLTEIIDPRFLIVIFDRNWCAQFYTHKIKQGLNFETNMEFFKNMLKDFFKYFKFTTSFNVYDDGFKTRLGIIKKDNQIKITSTFLLYNDGIRYGIVHFNNHDLELNAVEPNYEKIVSRISRFDLFRSYALARVKSQNFFSFRWSYMQEDFQFSSLYSGEEEIYMSESNNGQPQNFLITAYAKATSAINSFSDYVVVDMKIIDNNEFTGPNFNEVYGYWIRAKQSVKSAYVL
jgi:hypothetical protein